MEFLNSQVFKLVMIGTCILVVLFILGKLAMPLVRKILIGAVCGAIVSAFCYYVLHIPLPTVKIIGIASFLLGAIFGKLPN
jgi:hypothetical protein